MKKQSVKRVNIFLTDRELKALERLAEEPEIQSENMNMSDIIREAINVYAESFREV